MTDAWDDAEKAADQHGGGKFVRLENHEDKVVLAFCGGPYTREIYYNKAQEKYEPFTDEHKKAGKQPTLRVSLNCYVISENGNSVEPSMRIMEGGVKWFRSVLKNKKKYGLEKYFFEIERNGAKGDTKTTYSVLPDREITDEDRTAMKKLDLHDLAAAAAGSSDDDDFDSYDKKDGKSSSSDDPIKAEDADKIMGILRQRSKEEVNAFLEHFGVKRIKTLKQSQLKEALAYLEKKKDEPADDEDENDPFG